MQITPKMIAYRMLLTGKLDALGMKLRAAVTKKHAKCKVRADAITFDCDFVDVDALRKHPDFHCFSEGLLRQTDPKKYLAYGRIARFRTKSGSRFWVYSHPQSRNLAALKIMFFPEDRAGLRREEICSILELVRNPMIARMEIAFDFGVQSGINAAYIRRHGLFGKCRPRSVLAKENKDEWGSRKSAIFVRSYFKKEIGAHRLELQLNRRFLQKRHIKNIFDFKKLVRLLPVRQIRFVRLNELKMVAHLWHGSRPGREPGEVMRIMKTIVALEGNLSEWLAYLRHEEGVANVTRLLEPLETNALIVRALRRFVAKWSEKPTLLAEKK